MTVTPDLQSGWFFGAAGKSKGPFTWAELVGLAKAETISPDTMVYHQSFGEWKPAREIEGLPVTGPVSQARPVADHPSRTTTSSSSVSKRDWKIALGALALVIVLGVAGALIDQESQVTESGLNPIPEGGRTEKVEQPKPSFAEMMAEADRLEAESSYSLAKAQLQRVIRDYPESLSVESIDPRLAQLDSLGNVKRAEERAEIEERRLAGKWSYPRSTDAMTSRTTRQAVIRSENTINLDFPYQGAQHGTLILRDHPSYGRDVIFRIEEGQLLCSSYSGCQVRVRFDEGSAGRWSAVGPSDNSSTSLFIRNYSGFLGQLRRSRVVRIQPEIYQAGAPVFEFHVGGFDFERYSGR